jgi:hypothetical protein
MRSMRDPVMIYFAPLSHPKGFFADAMMAQRSLCMPPVSQTSHLQQKKAPLPL